ncbi:MAG: Protein-glutamate O-methyltransferase [Acidobacteriota bacterium]|nr:Protein-glutamate O-methyltransferase [Acidobacteriota bacterium]
MAEERKLTNAEFIDLQDFIYKKSGMFFPLSRKNFIEQKVLKRIESLEYKNFSDYLAILKKELYQTEIINLFNEITVNETFFFRDQPQFEALEKHIIPRLAASGRKNITILSAGCSSGEEPYTLAMILREKFPYLPFTICGIDISDQVIAKADWAEYTRYAVRHVPPDYLKKYFIPLENGNLKFRDEFKTGISFKKMNLMEFGASPGLKSKRYDVIFCRYVLIYFDRVSKQRVIDTFHEKIAENGYLILGNSESLSSVLGNFKILHFPSAIIYRRT